ncbi:MAG: YcxB family protein [Anaerolineales bacterium]
MQIEYTSSRSEVWNFYWYQWRRKKLWLTHLLVALAVFLFTFRFLALNVVASIFIAVLCVAWMPLFPLIMFKSSSRILRMDSNGIKTTIGTISGQRTWSQIEAVEKVQDKIVIFGKNGNGFIVPSRAFKNTNEADTFFKLAMEYQKNSNLQI